MSQVIFATSILLNNNVNILATAGKKKKATSTAVSCLGQHPAVSSYLPILYLRR